MSDFLRVLRLFNPYWHWMLLGTFLSIITTLANIGLLAVSGWFITAMALAGIAGVTMNYFTPGAIIRGLAITRTAGRYAERLITHEATFRLLASLRVWFFERLEPLAPSGLQSLQSADIFSRLRADIDSLDKIYLGIVSPAIVAIFTSLIVCGVIALFNPTLAIVIGLLLSAAGLLLPLTMQKLSYRAGKTVVEQRNAMRIQTIDLVQGLAELRSFNAIDAQETTILYTNQQLQGAQAQQNQLRGVSNAFVLFAANAAMLAALVILVPQVQTQQLDPAIFVSLVLLSLAAFEAVTPMPLAVQYLGEAMAAARRLFALADAKPMIQEPAQPLLMPTNFSLSVQHLSFCYPENERAAFENLSFHLEQGQHMAIFGGSGEGKSTLLKLFLRYWEASDGSLRIGDTDIRQLNSEDVRRLISVVSQKPHLFNATLRENLLIAKPDASDADMLTALKTAQLEDFVAKEGLDLRVGEAGMKLSGGQARRVAIARALLKDAPILFLDEPTEGLDTETAKNLVHALHAVMQNRTVIMVSHQPFALAGMDQYYRLQDGKLEAHEPPAAVVPG